MTAFVPGYALKSREIQSSGRFPSIGMEVFSMVLHLVGITMASAVLSRKLGWILQFPNWPRILVLINHIGAWCFFFTISILVDSIGMELSEVVCLLGVLTCLSFYACTKLTVYLFLAEKVYAVWSIGSNKGRLHCKAYLVSLGFIFSFSGIGVLLILQRIAYFRTDGLCVIGDTRVASIIDMSYDTFVNVLLTLLFVWPLLVKRLTPALRRIAIRSMWASTVALTGSCVNVGILAAMDGRELGWVCLASCAFDVMVNAATMYWVTSGNGDLTRPCEPDAGSKTVIDTVTAEGMVCTNASDVVSDLSTLSAGSVHRGHNRLSYCSTTSSDVASRRASVGLPPGSLPAPAPDRPLSRCSETGPSLAQDEAVCADGDEPMVDVQALCSQTRSLPALGSGSRPGHPFPRHTTSAVPMSDPCQRAPERTATYADEEEGLNPSLRRVVAELPYC